MEKERNAIIPEDEYYKVISKIDYAYELLRNIHAFDFTFDGTIKLFREKNPSYSEDKAAYYWMRDNFSLTSAMYNAAYDLTRDVKEILDQYL